MYGVSFYNYKRLPDNDNLMKQRITLYKGLNCDRQIFNIEIKFEHGDKNCPKFTETAVCGILVPEGCNPDFYQSLNLEYLKDEDGRMWKPTKKGIPAKEHRVENIADVASNLMEDGDILASLHHVKRGVDTLTFYRPNEYVHRAFADNGYDLSSIIAKMWAV